MKYYKSEFHEKLVRTDSAKDEAFAKPLTGGEEIALAPGSPILVDAVAEGEVITEEEYNTGSEATE